MNPFDALTDKQKARYSALSKKHDSGKPLTKREVKEVAKLALNAENESGIRMTDELRNEANAILAA